MTKIVKFPKDKIEYSDRFFRKVDPKAVTHYIRMSNSKLSAKVAHAIALAFKSVSQASILFIGQFAK